MNRALQSAATGMYAQQLYVDVIANNLANINTTAFKRSQMQFQDLLYETVRAVGTSSLRGSQTPTELEIGSGTRPVAALKIFSQGDITATDNPLDIALSGDGFFQILRPDRTIVYTRDGSFKLSAEGQIVTSDGFALEPPMLLPPDTTSIHISSDGLIQVQLVGEMEPQTVGQIELARFVNAGGLKSMGRNLYQATVASGEPILGTPGAEGFGDLSQGYLETSNVDVVKEMVNMIIAQRAYEINSKAIKTAEEMLSMANNLKR